ncbi:MAG: tetratricopeptide repeat protein [Candidatus Omnitrophota bacterium]
MRNFKLVFVLILIAILSLASLLLFIKNRMQISEMNNLSQSLHEVENEVGRLVQENEKLQEALEFAKAAAAKTKLEKEELEKKIYEIEKIAISKENAIEPQVTTNTVSSLEGKMRELNLHYNKELGLLYNKTKDYGKAISAFDKALESDPNDIESHLGLAIAYEKGKKDRDSAIFHYQKYLELNPEALNKKEVTRTIEKLRK